MGNVIKFPTNYVPDHPPEAYPDDMRDKEIAEENIAWCEELAEKLMYACLKNLQNNGVNIADKTTVGQLTFLAECIKSVVYHEKSIPHPLQEIADHFVSIENTKTPSGEPAIGGDFNILRFNEWMERNNILDGINFIKPSDEPPIEPVPA